MMSTLHENHSHNDNCNNLIITIITDIIMNDNISKVLLLIAWHKFVRLVVTLGGRDRSICYICLPLYCL